jgi:hypothetical protein
MTSLDRRLRPGEVAEFVSTKADRTEEVSRHEGRLSGLGRLLVLRAAASDLQQSGVRMDCFEGKEKRKERGRRGNSRRVH